MNNSKLQYIQENIIGDTIIKWKLQNMLSFFKRGDFFVHHTSPMSVKFWIQNNLGKITQKKKDLITKYAPELLKYI